MATVNVQCPKCKSEHIHKYGKDAWGEQRYCCMNEVCSTKIFKLIYHYNGSRPGIDEQIINIAANASGIRDTSCYSKLETMHDVVIGLVINILEVG